MNNREVLLLVAVIASVAGAPTDVGSWNDAARFATVESLVDRHTWQIDGSIFLSRTMDRAYIDGHYYSHRSPLPSLVLAAIYQAAQWIAGLKATDNPAAFCYIVTLLSSGLAYIIAVMSIERLGALMDLPASNRWPLTWTFAFGTVALTYSRAVNDHVFLLAVFAVLFVVLIKCAAYGWTKVATWNLVAIGTLAGVGYSIDLGVGPVLMVSVLTYVLWMTRRVSRLAIVVLSALPWVALHHGLTYIIGGTLRPLGAVAEYMTAWPGSPFTVDNLTGLGWAHDSLAGFLMYSIGLLVGSKGFLVHNPLLFFVPKALFIGSHAARQDRAMVWYSIALMSGSWLIYAISSNNYAGETATIRWFVPLLVPCYYVLIVAVRQQPQLRNEMAVVGLWSIVLGVLLWRRGPWVSSIGPRLWIINAAAFATWIAYRVNRRRSGR